MGYKGGIILSDNLFELLKNKRIIEILDGDTSFGEIETNSNKGNIKIAMPYLCGSRLCEISTDFGLPKTYSWKGGAQSRWIYLRDIIDHCIEHKRMSELLSFLFSKEQFGRILSGYTADIIESSYGKITTTIIEQINGILYFGGNELIQISGKFLVRPIETIVSVATPTIRIIDRSYIKDLSERAMKDVTDENYDSAITKSRTLLEEVFCYVIEKKNETPVDNGDIGKLYNQVKQLYNMHQSKELDKRINGLLSGLEKILNAISEMRNKDSDSHGVGARRISISEHHARLFVNSAMTMADFILAVGDKN